MSKRILVTGAAGFIGRHTLSPLSHAGFDIISIVNKSEPPQYSFREKTGNPDLVIKADLIKDSQYISEIMEEYKPEYLLHLAWDINPGYRDNSNNVDWMNASLSLIHQFANCGGRRAVIAGTCFDYQPDTLYGTCKRSLWNILQHSTFAQSLQLAYGRVYYLYGPHEAPHRLVPTIVNGLLAGKTVELKSFHKQEMNLSYVQDVADAFVYAVENNYIDKEFDILGEFVSIDKLATQMTDLFDVDRDQIVTGSLFEQPKIPYDHFNSGKIPPWTPKTSLTRGLTKTIEYWRGQRLNDI